MADISPNYSLAFLRECFEYKDGKLYWAMRPAHHFRTGSLCKRVNTRFGGKEVKGMVDKGAYMRVFVTIPGGRMRLSVARVIFVIGNGVEFPEGMIIDHIDGDKLNNDLQNLRVADYAINSRNRVFRKSSRLHTGVRRSGRGFGAMIGNAWLGTFDTAEAAIAARKAAEAAHGYTERHGLVRFTAEGRS